MSVCLIILTTSYHSSEQFELKMNEYLLEEKLIDNRFAEGTSFNNHITQENIRYLLLHGLSESMMPVLYNSANVLVNILSDGLLFHHIFELFPRSIIMYYGILIQTFQYIHIQ